MTRASVCGPARRPFFDACFCLQNKEWDYSSACTSVRCPLLLTVLVPSAVFDGFYFLQFDFVRYFKLSERAMVFNLTP